MGFTRISCVVCGVLGYWGCKREVEPLEMVKKAHQQRHGENHEVTWEMSE